MQEHSFLGDSCTQEQYAKFHIQHTFGLNTNIIDFSSLSDAVVIVAAIISIT